MSSQLLLGPHLTPRNVLFQMGWRARIARLSEWNPGRLKRRGTSLLAVWRSFPVPRCCMTILTESQAQWLPTPAYLLRLNMPVSCWLSMLSSCWICLAGPCLSSLCSICIICIICICLAVSAVSCCIYLAVPCLASICIRQKLGALLPQTLSTSSLSACVSPCVFEPPSANKQRPRNQNHQTQGWRFWKDVSKPGHSAGCLLS